MNKNDQSQTSPPQESSEPVILEQHEDLTAPQQTTSMKFESGWTFFTSSLAFLFKKPTFLIPIFICWIILASVILYLRYYWQIPTNIALGFLEIYIFLLLLAYIICLTNIMLLELIRQVEDDQNVSFIKALGETISLDAIKVVPLTIFFSFVWFIILLLRALTSKKRRRSRAEPSLEDAALTLGGINANPFSWLRLGLSMFEKLLRMTVFLALPAIAWENQGSFSAFKKAIVIIKTNPIQFLTTYALTEVAATIMAIPFIPLSFMLKARVSISSEVWVAIIIYEGVIWTLGIYLEQMSVALLYLWYLKWTKNGAIGNLASFVAPNLLQDFHNLKSPEV